MEIGRICGIALVTAMFSLFLKKDNPALAQLLALSGSIGILLLVLHALAELAAWCINYGTMLQTDSLTMVWQAAGIALGAQLAMSCCKSAGQQELSFAVELAARILIFTTALPLLRQLLAQAVTLLQ